MRKEPKWVGFCCVVILSVLYAVGVVRHGMLRNIAQTLPLWIPIVLALRKFVTAKPGSAALFGHLQVRLLCYSALCGFWHFR